MEEITNAEAIETLRANYPDACFEQLREAVDKAIKALEADVPDTNVGDTISRQTAINLLTKWANGYNYIEVETQSAINKFEQLPSADVQPIQHERWNKIDVSGLATCGCGYITDRYSAFKYCPNCGAKMEVER